MSDPDAEVWRYTFEPGPDFTLEVRGQIIGRIVRDDVMPGGSKWGWSITCVRQFVGMTKPSKTDSGYVDTKAEAVEALRAMWALERDWRAEMRALTPYHDAGMTHWVGLTAWETYERPSAAEMPELREVGRELGLDAMKPWEIYQAVCREVEPTEANREERLAEVRRRLIAVAESEEERPWCVVRKRMLTAGG
ncbi:hypothetical protein MPPM_2537 [Methylorubrum populi]|uniref:Uncharacterized protein n=1 Tax=Methylorubrum populi TaxID=223967 RepID=A0A169R213_9HYPH|nr:hypothetical protein [Methylorubrum populi]BAU91142.1 hypothetical protein MPPM_2537 [Methylorubrum populi]